jgi:hypothetical protein
VVVVAVVLVAVVAQALRPAVEAGLRWPLRLEAELALPEEVVSLARETASSAALHLPARQSFSAATARISASTEKPTSERAPRSR